jgi:transposase
MAKTQKTLSGRSVIIGLDVGDRASRYCILEENGEVLLKDRVPTTVAGVKKAFAKVASSRIALEVGTHSPWISRELVKMGHEVVVANPRRVQLIAASTRKDDRMDARTLARLVRIDPQLLAPIRHRSAEAQAHLMIIRARAAMVEVRTKLINAARGLVKSCGERLPAKDAGQVRSALADGLPSQIRESIVPVLDEVDALTKRIAEYDRCLEAIAREHYPEVALLKEVNGVGTLVALTFVLTIEDATRFSRSGTVGSYLGLRPRRRDSGQNQPQLRISKEGDPYLRQLLVQSAHHILGPFGRDSDLRRWGLGLAQHGGKNAKRRAAVAVARKLAVLLHRLWVSGTPYEPLWNERSKAESAAA